MVTGYIPFPTPDRIRSLKWDWPPGSTPSVSLQKLLASIFQPAEKRASMDLLLAEAWATEVQNKNKKKTKKKTKTKQLICL
jgi:hypothetical protein